VQKYGRYANAPFASLLVLDITRLLGWSAGHTIGHAG
jgi:hypothetical protein